LDQFLPAKKKPELYSQASDTSLEEPSISEVITLSKPTVTAFLKAKQSKNLVNFDKLPRRQLLNLTPSAEPNTGAEMKVEDEEIINPETNGVVSDKDEEHAEGNEDLQIVKISSEDS